MPYFVDPLNRAVEKAWAAGVVVVSAAGNTGGRAETITVPGNDPYVITVGAVNTQRTPGVWSDDTLPMWSSVGPCGAAFAYLREVLRYGWIISPSLVLLAQGISALTDSVPRAVIARPCKGHFKRSRAPCNSPASPG